MCSIWATKQTPRTLRMCSSTSATSASRLEELITNLLDMSRIEAGCSSRPRLHSIWWTWCKASSVAQRWPAADIHVDVVPDAAFIRADPVLLERVAVNLLDNAAREVRGQSDQRIDVRDARGRRRSRARRRPGCGLSEADAELLFTPFYRLEERDPRLGAGLGLAICKGFVAAMKPPDRVSVASVTARPSPFDCRTCHDEPRVGGRR